MSELTKCNRCTLDSMERDAKRQGRRVVLEADPTPDFPNGVRAYYIKQGDDSHLKVAGTWFAVLPELCEC